MFPHSQRARLLLEQVASILDREEDRFMLLPLAGELIALIPQDMELSNL